jgi:C4-dicarboxylate transporter DctM subunit
LIPPSTHAIMYAILVDLSPAKVLMAGLLPGILLAVLFSIIIYVWVWLKPAAAPMGTESFSFMQKISSTGKISPIVLLFLVIIGGMYTGFFSPTEAAGIGAVMAIVIAYIWKVLKWPNFKRALMDGVKISGFVLMIILASSLFSRAVAMSHLADLIYNFMFNLAGGNNTLLIVAVIILFIILGCFLDSMAILMLFVPLFFPIVVHAGFDGIWFGVIVMQAMNVSMMTPPLAPCIFVTQALNPECTMTDVLKGSLPFYIANIGILFLLVWVPIIAMLIPNSM